MIEPGRLKMICPHCYKTLDGHMTTDGEMDNPGEGDICVCCYCHSVLECLGNGHLKRININDIVDKESRDTLKVALHLAKWRTNNVG